MPTTRREIERFISGAIRSSTALDEHTLRALIAETEPNVLHAYLQELVARQAFRTANQIPDWKTRDRQRVFQNSLEQSAATATEGAWWQDRVFEHLKTYVSDERSRAEAFRGLPWVARLQAHIGVGIVFASFLLVPFFVLGVVQANLILDVGLTLYLVAGIGTALWFLLRRGSKRS